MISSWAAGDFRSENFLTGFWRFSPVVAALLAKLLNRPVHHAGLEGQCSHQHKLVVMAVGQHVFSGFGRPCDARHVFGDGAAVAGVGLGQLFAGDFKAPAGFGHRLGPLHALRNVHHDLASGRSAAAVAHFERGFVTLTRRGHGVFEHGVGRSHAANCKGGCSQSRFKNVHDNVSLDQ